MAPEKFDLAEPLCSMATEKVPLIEPLCGMAPEKLTWASSALGLATSACFNRTLEEAEPAEPA